VRVVAGERRKVFHGKRKFEEKDQMYRQKRSIGGFVAAIIKPDGTYLTSCGIAVHKARSELIGKDRKQKGPMQADQAPDPDLVAPEEKLEGPQITQKDELEKFITRAINEHKIKPDIIVVYRDGVAESQLDQAKQFEVSQVKRAAPGAMIAFTVIQKRIHTRFLITGARVGNPPPGTCVTSDLGLLTYPNFYLVPSDCNLSTAKPVQYIILQNDGIPLKELQQLTFTACHLYPNWTASIKLPFPTQAAHKMAYLLGEIKVAEPQIHPNLHKTYFYL